MKKSPFQNLYDFVLAPLRLTVLPDEISEKIGLTSLESERIHAVLPHVSGKLLDIGCGKNTLVKHYHNGVGVDVYDWENNALIVADTSTLPFSDKSFDTVTFVASLNHIPNREAVLREANRLLSNEGRLIVTMINPFLSYIGHRFLWWYGEDKTREMAAGEVYGFWTKNLVRLVENSGFKLLLHQKFVYKLNTLYVFKKIKR